MVEEDRRRRDRRQPAPTPDPDLWEAAGFQLTEEGRVMPQWEYKLEELSSREVPRLNRLGREGWEAVAVMPVSGREPVQYVVLFKRPTRG